ncbi:MAG TPA: Mrp/NBP35 family ATP-binding protein [Chloroflexota bacterium]
MFGSKKEISREAVLHALSAVQDPELHRDLVTLGMVQDIEIQDGKVSFTVTLTTPACPLRTQIEQDARAAVMALPGVSGVEIKWSSRVPTGGVREKAAIPGIKNVIAVGSGKGGVGKSTVSVGLALALADTGARVGLLDADVWGPNIPQMMGVQVPPSQNGAKLVPGVSRGVKMMSMAFFVSTEQAVIWRGPMVGKMVTQLLTDVDWGELDYLIVDLPPGTGDASLSLAQAIPLAGLVVVTTPQDVALADAAKAIGLFKQLDVPIVGVVENMSYFVCPHCNERTEIFGHGGAQRLADDHGVPLLGQIPLDPAVRAGGDIGAPVVAEDPDSPVTSTFREIAGLLAGRVSVLDLEPELAR